MSAESELELRIAALDPQQFERLVYDLVYVDHSNVIHPKSPDAGADVLVPASRERRALVWQAKRYTGRIAWDKCVASLSIALDRYDPEEVTFVFPRDLSERELKTFEMRLAGRPVRVELWSLSTLRTRLQENPHVHDRYFPSLHPSVQGPSPPTPDAPVVAVDEDTTLRHVFISYVREDASAVDRLTTELEAAGVEVRLDRDRLTPGVRWQALIREAIEEGTFFIACFSKNSSARRRSYMNEELVIAIEELRKRPSERAWFLPVLLDPGTVPRRDIGAGETLHDIHYVALYDDWGAGLKSLLATISPDQHDREEADARLARFKHLVADNYREGDYFESFAAAALNTSVPSLPHDEILRHFHMRTVVPPRYLYSAEAGADQWIRLCRDVSYQYHRDTVGFWLGSAGEEIAGLIQTELGRNSIDYVSLGCGDGRKDAGIVGHWLASQADVLYYPYDVSLQLVTRAVREVHGISTDGGRLHTKAVLADFDQLNAMGDVFRQRASPKVVALLGGSLGNLQRELELLFKVKEAMSSEDLLLLEVRLASDRSQKAELELAAEAGFYLGALRGLGFPFETDKATYRIEQDVSAIRGTSTCIIGYDAIEIDGKSYRDLSLAHIHFYGPEDFLGALAAVGFEVIHSQLGGQDEQFLVCIARPQI